MNWELEAYRVEGSEAGRSFLRDLLVKAGGKGTKAPVHLP